MTSSSLSKVSGNEDIGHDQAEKNSPGKGPELLSAGVNGPGRETPFDGVDSGVSGGSGVAWGGS